MKKLSAYTVASNCTDLTDIRDGIAEIHEAMKTCVESGKHRMKGYVSRIQRKPSSLHVFQRYRHVYPSSRCNWMQPCKPITFSFCNPFLQGKSPVCETYII